MSEYAFPGFTFRAAALKVVDGDTVDLLIDTGFRTYKTERIRLVGIDTPEMNSRVEADRVLALAAKNKLAELLKIDLIGANLSTVTWNLLIVTSKSDSFGRWLAEIFVDGVSVNQKLIELGLAEEYVR